MKSMLRAGWFAASFYTSAVSRKIVPKNLKGKKKSSQDWLTRQLNDPYIKLAKRESYRARSAFKLLEIDDRHKILHHGQTVVECGAAPGAWTQIAVPRVNSIPEDEKKPRGLVVGIDLQHIYALEGATFLGGKDFTREETQQEILNFLGGKKVDIVLSDMAPKSSGIKQVDHDRIIDLAYSALTFATQHSAAKGTLLCKVWDGSSMKKLKDDLEKVYGNVRIIKPPSSRNDSAEKFFLCRNFKGSGR